MTIRVSGADWAMKLAQAIKSAQPGDVISVDSEAKVELAQRAMQRMGSAPIPVVIERGP